MFNVAIYWMVSALIMPGDNIVTMNPSDLNMLYKKRRTISDAAMRVQHGG